MSTQILRMREVIQRIGLSRSTIYKLMENNDFPKPMKLGSQAIGWRDTDIETWISNRPISPIGNPGSKGRELSRDL
ncbi:MAG: AlpA family transcriptional regulator [Rhodobacteraceae bacterium]|nr:AlpA family transcriptional regulator [Paracoccaceae bacterium]MCC6009219.1 AlpA family transcriptional regulator [Paracoccaceae bacterium]